MADMMSAEAQVKELLRSNNAIVFSKSYCPYCKDTKSLLSKCGIKASITELDQVADGAAMQDYLETFTSQRSVPNVFFKDFSSKDYSGIKTKELIVKGAGGAESSADGAAGDAEVKDEVVYHVGGNSDLQAIGAKVLEQWQEANQGAQAA